MEGLSCKGCQQLMHSLLLVPAGGGGDAGATGDPVGTAIKGVPVMAADVICSSDSHVTNLLCHATGQIQAAGLAFITVPAAFTGSWPMPGTA